MAPLTNAIFGILLLALAGAGIGPSHAQQQLAPGQSDTQKDPDKRTKRAIVPGEHENTRCYTSILLDAYNRYGVFGTIGSMPTELLNTLPGGVSAVAHYCNINYRACEQAAQSFQSRSDSGGSRCN